MTALAETMHTFDRENAKNRGSHIADGLNRMQDLVDGPIAEILAAKDAEIAGLRADARRYRYLRDEAGATMHFVLSERRERDEWDAEIDETISALAGEGV